jgi:hypothetical protein
MTPLCPPSPTLEAEVKLLKLICVQNNLRLNVAREFIIAQQILLNSLKLN